MKKMIRILSVALIAAMLLSLSAAALAADVTVYIPSKLAKMGLPDMLNYDGIPTKLITLRTKTDCAWTGDYKTTSNGNIKYDYNGNPIKNYGVVEDAEIHLHFSRRPDWAGVSWSNGWENLEIDDAGDAVTSIEGHPIQPGMWAASGPCDPLTGKPAWYVSGGDYPYSGGKDWGNGLTVNYNWHRNGQLYKVEYQFDGEDFFKTGMEGAKSSIIYERVNVQLDCGSWKLKEITDDQAKLLYQYLTDDTQPELIVDEDGNPILDENGNEQYTPYIPPTATVDPETENIVYPYEIDEDGNLYYDGEEVTMIGQKFYRWVYDYSETPIWYVSQVKATYPAGNPIVAVEADFRNDEKGNLYGYKISYATSETEVYKITYAPKTTTVVESHTYKDNGTTDKIYYNKVLGYDAKGNILKDLDGKNVTYPATVGANTPSTKAAPIFLHHYTADEPIYGEYYVDGTLVAVSGSGNKLNKWYKPGHGKQIRKPGLKGVSSFTSPRVW